MARVELEVVALLDERSIGYPVKESWMVCTGLALHLRAPARTGTAAQRQQGIILCLAFGEMKAWRAQPATGPGSAIHIALPQLHADVPF